ncbi:MAG: hypothetical protein WA728_24965 [Xanthobacteraceae bacterium]
MFKQLLFDVIGHLYSLSEAQLKQIEKSLPATKALIDLLNRAQPIIEQAEKLYGEAQPLIDQAMKEWQAVGPAAQILIDAISHHLDKGGSPAEAAEAVRAALGGSIKKVAQDRLMDRGMSRITVFGGTGFLGRRVVRRLSESGATVRSASRHPGRAEGNNVERIAADARDDQTTGRDFVCSEFRRDRSKTNSKRCLSKRLGSGSGRGRLRCRDYADHPALAVAEQLGGCNAGAIRSR